jgi:adenine-specific DNA-methyltransferase
LEDQVDCIYIDPPYNTGDKSWRYNNDYVDGNDRWRHSKWLSFMEKRLELAKRLLKPDGVLIVTIDEHEVRHLGLLLEHVLPDANIQMVSTLINPALQSRAGAFGRSDESVFFVMRGSVGPRRTLLTRDWVSDKGRTFTGTARWDLLRRSGTGASRKDSPGGFYPIYIDPNGPQFHSVGAPLPPGTSEAPSVDEAVSVLPIRKNGTEGRWQLSSGVLKQYMTQGRVRIGGSEGSGFVLYYLKGGEYDKVLNGEYPISGRNPDGSLKVGEGSEDGKVVAVPSTQWRIPSHDATQYGSRLIASFLQNSSFTYPKSVYAVQDALSFFLEDSPEATVIDFFAGSGTTLHATALLNAGDGGQRRCILVTNNEVSEEEAATLRLAGHAPGDSEWEAKGIFESVTSPRVKAALTGKLPDGTSVQGKYLDERPYADGFNENCEFFRLEYLDPEEIEVGAQFAAIHPLLWLTAGGRAKRDDGLSPAQEWSIVEAGGYAVLFQELAIRDFVTTLNDTSGIEHVFLITDSEDAFAEMSEAVGPSFETHMLYRDYLRSFRIQAVGPQ